MILPDSLIDAEATAAAARMKQEDLARLHGYWVCGNAIIDACLKKAVAADPADAPIGLSTEEVDVWHRAQAEAYSHAIEMMGVPDGANATEG